MIFDVLTIFPELFEGCSVAALLAVPGKKENKTRDLGPAEFAEGRHKHVDDRPYGGGPGMVMKPEPFYRGVRRIKAGRGGGRVILLSSRGRLLDQNKFEELTRRKHHTACRTVRRGRRAGCRYLWRRLSTWRLRAFGRRDPGRGTCRWSDQIAGWSTGQRAVLDSDSFSRGNTLGPPQYTRPREFEGKEVPEVLLSGDHQKVADYRKEAAGKIPPNCGPICSTERRKRGN